MNTFTTLFGIFKIRENARTIRLSVCVKTWKYGVSGQSIGLAACSEVVCAGTTIIRVADRDNDPRTE